MRIGMLIIAAFIAAVLFAVDADAKCGKAGHIGLFQRRADHRQLRHEHASHNAAMASIRRSSVLIVPMQVAPAKGPEKIAPPAKKAVAVPMQFTEAGTCTSGTCGSALAMRGRRGR